MDEEVLTCDDAMEAVDAIYALAELLLNQDIGREAIEYSPGRLNRLGRLFYDEAEKLEKYIKSI